MSLHYIIDGYNVIKQIDALKAKKLRFGREALIRFIEQKRPQGSPRNKVTLVFDGKAEFSGPQEKTSLNVIFSKSGSADDKIKKMVENCSDPRNIVVVTDDRQVMYYCRSVGSRVSSVREFMNAGGVRKKNKSVVQIPDKPKCDSRTAEAITEQMRKIWLKE